MTAGAMDWCNCEHANHRIGSAPCSCPHTPGGARLAADHCAFHNPARHAYLAVVAGSRRAMDVGPVCDACADGHLAAYVIPDGGTPSAGPTGDGAMPAPSPTVGL